MILPDEIAVSDCHISVPQRCYQRSYYAVSENVRDIEIPGFGIWGMIWDPRPKIQGYKGAGIKDLGSRIWDPGSGIDIDPLSFQCFIYQIYEGQRSPPHFFIVSIVFQDKFDECVYVRQATGLLRNKSTLPSNPYELAVEPSAVKVVLCW